MSELDKLEKYLKDKGIEYTRKPLFDGEQITVYENGERMWDVVWHYFSIGHEKGLLEAMGIIVPLGADSVRGNLTAEEVIRETEKLK